MATGFPIIFSPRLWTPSSIAMLLWLDAADANTITLNGSTVSQWNDKSGNGRNATQATASNQPVYVGSAINNLPAITFDGVNDRLEVSNESAFDVATFTIFLIGKKRSGNGSFIGKCDAADITTRRRKLQLRTGAFISGTDANELAISDATGDFIRAFSSVGNSDHIDRLNGTQANYTQTLFNDQYNNVNLTIGCAFFVGAEFLDGQISELIIVNNRNFTTIQLVEGYLAWKWGMVSSLPSTHPYKNSPPYAP